MVRLGGLVRGLRQIRWGGSAGRRCRRVSSSPRQGQPGEDRCVGEDAAGDGRVPVPGGWRAGWPGRLVAGAGALAGRHRVFAVAAAVAVLPRVVAMLGFQPALLLRLDSYDYLRGAVHLSPNLINVSAYSVFLWLLLPLHSLVVVVAVQHVMGLGVAGLVYALLRRYGLPGWGATLAAAPVLFDPGQLLAEQLVMADLLAMTLMMAGLTVLLTGRVLSWPATVAAGLLIGASATVRPTVLPLVLLVPAYLLLRGAGWRRAGGRLRGGVALAAGLVPVLGYMAWFAAMQGTFNMTDSNGLFLWSRTMSFANCAVISPPADLRALCADAQPGVLAQPAPSLRPPPISYLWDHGAWQWQHPPPGLVPGTSAFTAANNGRALRFAIRAIGAQPLAYLGVVARDSLQSFAIASTLRFPGYQPSTALFPPADRGYAIGAIQAYTGTSQGIAGDLGSGLGTRLQQPYAAVMHVYQRFIFLPGPVLALIVLAGLASCLTRRRRTAEGTFLWVSAVILMIFPAAGHEYAYRYILPSVPLACAAAALALRRPAGQPLAQPRQGAGPAAWAWPWAAVELAVTWNLWQLRATVLPAQYLNDSSVHEQMVRFATAVLRAGDDPLTSWFPYLNLGSPQFLHYQAAPAILTGLAGLVTGPDTAFRWSVYLLWCLWPAAVYCSARVFGLSRPAAAGAAAVAPLLHSALGIGYEQHAYLWAGFGVWTQLWGSWALPFAWALTWRAMADKRLIAPAAALVALTAAFHYETGYLAFGAVLVMPFLIRRGILARLGRAAWLLAASLLASAWVVIPLLRYSRWAAINQALASGPSANGYGARVTLGWLITGKVLDDGHLPVITLLAAAGLAVAVVSWRRAGPQRALAVMLAACLLLSFGRSTFGGITGIIPGSTDIFFRRFLMGTQLAAIYLGGLGAASTARQGLALAGRCARRLARYRPAGPAWTPAAAAAAAVAGLACLYPAWHYLGTRDAANAAAVQAQRSAQASQTDAQAIAALQAAILRHGPGRVYAGSQYNTQLYPAVGLVPMYAYLESLDIDEVGYTLRTASLMSQPEYNFDPGNPGDYTLFGIRYLILPSGQASQQPPPGAVLILSDNLLSVFELPGNSYIRVADTVGGITASRADIGSQTAPYLNSALPGQDRYLTVGYAGARPAPPTLPTGTRAAGPPGTVITEHADLAGGTATTTVHLRRRAVVVLSASFDPGWSVTIDGKPAAPQMIAPALTGVTVPPGTHHVSFRYTGFGGYPELLALAAAALLATAWLTRRWPASQHHRQPAATATSSPAADLPSAASAAPGTRPDRRHLRAPRLRRLCRPLRPGTLQRQPGGSPPGPGA